MKQRDRIVVVFISLLMMCVLSIFVFADFDFDCSMWEIWQNCKTCDKSGCSAYRWESCKIYCISQDIYDCKTCEPLN